MTGRAKFAFDTQAGRIERFRRSKYNQPVVDNFLEKIGTAVIVLSSPRSGSSLLASALRRTDQVLHFQGAITPFLGMCNLRYPESNDSDALDASHGRSAEFLAPYLAQECGTPLESIADRSARDQFAVDLAIRLTMQWPEIDFDLEAVRASAKHALEELVEDFGWQEGEFPDPAIFHAVFIRQLRNQYPAVNPYLYDLDAEIIRQVMPDVERVSTLPSHRFVEMPPFITIRPWRRASLAELSSKPVIIKTVANTFRLPFLEAILPSSKFRILHLTRSVAASANGMYDGWHHPGFWCARVDAELSIPGYTDTYPEWGRHWWKFGLFPGWKDYISSSPIDIAAQHWRVCHTTILDWLCSHREQANDALRVHAEDFLSNTGRKAEAYSRIAAWLGIRLDAGLEFVSTNDLPLQLATSKPAPQRWRKRHTELQHVIADQRNIELMKRLGYPEDTELW